MGQPKLSTVVHGFDILKSIIGLARTYNPVFLFSAIAASAAILGAAVALWVLYSWLRTGVIHLRDFLRSVAFRDFSARS